MAVSFPIPTIDAINHRYIEDGSNLLVTRVGAFPDDQIPPFYGAEWGTNRITYGIFIDNQPEAVSTAIQAAHPWLFDLGWNNLLNVIYDGTHPVTFAIRYIHE